MDTTMKATITISLQEAIKKGHPITAALGCSHFISSDEESSSDGQNE